MNHQNLSDRIEHLLHVDVAACDTILNGDLGLPADATGLVLFTQGPGSSRSAPRTHFETALLRQHRLGTLAVDLLTNDEERADASRTRSRGDDRVLGARLAGAAAWLSRHRSTAGLPLAVYAVGAAAGPALALAAAHPHLLTSVVLRSASFPTPPVDLAHVRAPVLLLAGALDEPGLDANQHVLMHLERTESHLEIVAGATHTFEEPGAIEQATALAGTWFRRWSERPVEQKPSGASERPVNP